MIDSFLQSGSPLIYALLALIAFGDALIGAGIFVVGEVAFLAAGATLGATGSWWAVALVLLSAWLGDLTSFFIGRRHGASVCRRLWTSARRRRIWRRTRARLTRHGAFFVVAARFMGPVAWFTPFMAGTLHMSLLRFAPASAVGVLLGAGQFIAVGAFGIQAGDLLGQAWDFVLAHWALCAILLSIAVTQIAIWRLSRRGRLARLLMGALAAVTILAGANLIYFFGPAPAMRAEAATVPQPVAVCELAQTELLALPGSTGLHLPQPVNVALLSSYPPERAMEALGWKQNRIFMRGSISLPDYIGLLLDRTPPVSELLFRGETAQSAFQLPGTLTERVHIRWWRAGTEGAQTLYLGAVSRDEEIAIKYYGPIPALLHDIDPEVDLTRDGLAKEFARLPGYSVEGTAPLLGPKADGLNTDYVTDGEVLFIGDKDAPLPPRLRTCLGLS